MNILIIAATHGNELLGIKLYQRLLQTHSPLLEYVDFIIGNPRAYAARTRYIESDLNRSYQSDGTRYEEERARDIKHYVATTNPDLILDMHTTTCEQPNCLIVADTSGVMRQRYLRASHIDTVLQVHSLNDIASIGDNVIGYEVPNRRIEPQLLDEIIEDLRRFVDRETGSSTKYLFKMTDKIYKKDVTTEQAASFVNFQMHKLGFVPIMVGENSYKKQTDYLGFKASAPVEVSFCQESDVVEGVLVKKLTTSGRSG
jgi:aspartoacylase